jgi:hypothetical protein
MAWRKERILASVSTIVVVAGQTQVHTVTLATVRPAIVPPIVPGPPPSGMQRRPMAEADATPAVIAAHQVRVKGVTPIAQGLTPFRRLEGRLSRSREASR